MTTMDEADIKKTLLLHTLNYPKGMSKDDWLELSYLYLAEQQIAVKRSENSYANSYANLQQQNLVSSKELLTIRGNKVVEDHIEWLLHRVAPDTVEGMIDQLNLIVTWIPKDN